MPVMARGLSQLQKPDDKPSAGARERSIATLVRYGPSTSAKDFRTIEISAIATCQRYGRRYFSSRAIRRLSYALPNTSSSCDIDFLDDPLLKDQVKQPPALLTGYRK